MRNVCRVEAGLEYFFSLMPMYSFGYTLVQLAFLSSLPIINASCDLQNGVKKSPTDYLPYDALDAKATIGLTATFVREDDNPVLSAPIDWLGDPQWAMPAIVLLSVWKNFGYNMVILLAGLQAIPKDVYEAAEMDAASPMRVLFRITLPLLMPNLIVVLVLVMIRAVQTFDEVFVLTGGGPGSATTFIVQYIYLTGFAEQIHLYGLAAAASLILAIGLMTLTLAQLRLSKASEAGKLKK